MAKSTSTSEGQDESGDTVSLDKSTDTTEPNGDVTASGSPSTESPSTESATDGSAEAEPKRKRGRRARRAAAAARAGDESTADEDATSTAGLTSKASGKGKSKVTGPTTSKARGGPSDRRSSANRLAQVITALLVVAVLLAVILLVQLIKGPGNASKLAAREDRREAARQAAETSVARLFSFDYKKLDADLADQRAQTTGDFTNEVEKVTGPALRPIAAKEHVVVQAVALTSAVVDDNGPDVQVLVFLNQAVTLDLLPAPRLDRNRLLASMRQVNGQWKVAGIKAL
jgi:hypothetical protein